MDAPQRRCPRCATNLVREQYESVWAMRCPACRGALISSDRLERVERDPARSPTLLKQEARAEHGGDYADPTACPRCHGMMKLKTITRGSAELHLDLCQACDLYWLDGGELALVQLLYETSPQGQEARALQRRALEASLSPERQARLHQAMARLPDDVVEEAPLGAPDLLTILRALWSR